MATRADLLGFSNNADLSATLTAMTGGATPPWSGLTAWAAGVEYQSGSSPSFVTYNGDLYVAAPGAANWVAGDSFSADVANWVLVASAASWQASPVSLSGATLKMVLAPASSDGVTPATPIAPALTLTSAAGGGLTIGGTSHNQVTVAISAPQMRALRAQTYAYDLVAVWTSGQTVTTARLFYGAISIAQGVS